MIFIFRKNMQILPNPGFDLYANKRKKVTPKKQVGLFFVVMNSRNLLRTTFGTHVTRKTLVVGQFAVLL